MLRLPMIGKHIGSVRSLQWQCQELHRWRQGKSADTHFNTTDLEGRSTRHIAASSTGPVPTLPVSAGRVLRGCGGAVRSGGALRLGAIV